MPLEPRRLRAAVLFERALVLRAEPDLLALLDRELLEREAPLPLLLDAPVPLLAPVERAPLPVDREDEPVLLVSLLDARDELPDRPPEPEESLAPELSSPLVHLPLSTRCAASATASAINDPSRVALETIVVAAELAESAASRPASRIFFRALGLALIAAAAAASPAASISLLMAALAILSTVVSLELLEPEDDPLDCELEPPVERLDEEDDFRLLDLAIANLPVGSRR